MTDDEPIRLTEEQMRWCLRQLGFTRAEANAAVPRANVVPFPVRPVRAVRAVG